MKNGDRVKIVFKNNVFLEGTLIDENQFIIQIRDGFVSNISFEEILYIKTYKTMEEIVNSEDPLYENAANIASQRISQIEIDKDDLLNRMKGLTNNNESEVNYGAPSISALKIPEQYSTEKNRSKIRRNKIEPDD